MKNNKRKSTVLIKLLGPVIALGLLTMITAAINDSSTKGQQNGIRKWIQGAYMF